MAAASARSCSKEMVSFVRYGLSPLSRIQDGSCLADIPVVASSILQTAIECKPADRQPGKRLGASAFAPVARPWRCRGPAVTWWCEPNLQFGRRLGGEHPRVDRCGAHGRGADRQCCPRGVGPAHVGVRVVRRAKTTLAVSGTPLFVRLLGRAKGEPSDCPWDRARSFGLRQLHEPLRGGPPAGVSAGSRPERAQPLRGAYIDHDHPDQADRCACEVVPIRAEPVDDHAPGEGAGDEDATVGARTRPKFWSPWKSL